MTCLVEKWFFFSTFVLAFSLTKVNTVKIPHFMDKFSIFLSWKHSYLAMQRADSKSMPEIFKKTYPSTRCILDCTELFCQRPSSLSIQSSLYSSYKHHVTYKALIGIAPSGAITFVGQLFEGYISDKEIVQRS